VQWEEEGQCCHKEPPPPPLLLLLLLLLPPPPLLLLLLLLLLLMARCMPVGSMDVTRLCVTDPTIDQDACVPVGAGDEVL
jgi:hypothetical protein